MADYTSFTPWKNQIEDLEPSVPSKSYRISPSGRNVRLFNARGRDEGMVAYIDDQGELGGSERLLDRLRPILDGPTDEELEDENATTVSPVSEPETIARTTLNPGSGSLEAFARSGAGGLRNEQNEEAAITELQEFLVSLGEDTGGIDGKYGPRTTAAVRRFQEAVTGIAVDGDAGPETIGKIQEIQNDLREIERLLQRLEESITDISKFGYYKSTLMNTLLEAELSTEELNRLRQLQSKYESFVQEFPDFEADLFQQVNTAIQTNGQSGLSNDEITRMANDAIDSAEEPAAQEPAAQEPAAQEPAASSSNTTYNARTPVEDLKLPLEGGDAQQQATEQYNNLIDQENFEEAANALRDNEALGVPPQGLEAELRRRAAATPPSASSNNTDTAPATPQQTAPAQTSGYRFATNPQGEFYARVNEWPFELPSSHRSIANAQNKDVRIIQVAGGAWAATVWNGQRSSAPIPFNSWQPRFRTAWMGWLSANGYDPQTGQPNS